MEPEFSFGSFNLWPDGTLYRGDTQIHLPSKELAALRFLLSHAGQVVTSTQLRQALWGDVHVTSDSVPHCVSSLRARLEPDQCIQTIYKRGYRLVGQVRSHTRPEPPSWRVAVMPFATGHNVLEYMGAAVAEEVTARLTSTGSGRVSVLARDSVFTLARRGLSAVQVGEVLRADYVLAGTLLAMTTQYRLRVEMIRVEGGTQIWVEDAVGPLGQLLELETRVVERLLFRLGGDPFAANSIILPPMQAHAYEMFLRGHQEWQNRERHRMQDGMQHLIQATELDPSLISAQVDLAKVCVSQEFFGFLAPDAAARQVHRIAALVPDLASDAPALQPILGWVRFHVDRDLAGALDLFSASALLPHARSTTRMRVMFALSRHRFDEALDWIELALIADPYASWLHGFQAWALHLAGRRAKSVEVIERALDTFPEDHGILTVGAAILAFNGHADRATRLAEELVRRAPYYDVASALHAYTLAANGDHSQAHEILERLQWLSRERYVLRSFTSVGFAALGEREEAIAELKAANDQRCPWFFQMLADPRLEPLHGHPEFEKMRATVDQLERSTADVLEYQL